MSTVLLDTVSIDVFGSLSIALVDISQSVMMNLVPYLFGYKVIRLYDGGVF